MDSIRLTVGRGSSLLKIFSSKIFFLKGSIKNPVDHRVNLPMTVIYELTEITPSIDVSPIIVVVLILKHLVIPTMEHMNDSDTIKALHDFPSTSNVKYFPPLTGSSCTPMFFA